MAKILPDTEIKRLIDLCILNGSNDCVAQNSYDLRLGGEVVFKATDERVELGRGDFLEVGPGDFVEARSLETIDFTPTAVAKIYPGEALMGLIATRTTLMKEGLSQISTKIDPGFRGPLQWAFRNNTHRPVTIPFGERLFNLLIFRLAADETPESIYGLHPSDYFQDAETKRVKDAAAAAEKASRDRVYRLQQLRQVGPPLSYLGEEVDRLDQEVKSLRTRFEEFMGAFRSTVEDLITSKTLQGVAAFTGLTTFLVGITQFLRGRQRLADAVTVALMVLGVGLMAVFCVIAMRRRSPR